MAVQGGEVTADAAGAVGEHPERISTSRISFALFRLCRVGCTEEAEWGVPGLRTDRQAQPPAIRRQGARTFGAGARQRSAMVEQKPPSAGSRGQVTSFSFPVAQS